MRYLLIFLSILISGCIGIPEGIEPVRSFEINRYLGTWYEIARLDHSFERGLQNVTAEYSPRNDGGLKVINRGFDSSSKTWSEAEGKAYFVEDKTTGYLKVSFFGPFYGSYIIFDLGQNYEYSLVTSTDKSYLWLLSRTPVIDETLKQRLLKRMTKLGFDTQALIFVEQSQKAGTHTH
ncbi:MAG: lipocalin family protein [Pseudomonadales bacterium]|nr:lipocalin family protein [Pseudomonadales bacterium]